MMNCKGYQAIACLASTVSRPKRIYPRSARVMILALIIFMLLPSHLMGGEHKESAGAQHAATLFPFSPGEKLTYRGKWGLIRAGEITLEVLPRETIDGIETYHFAMVTRTSSTADVFYRVRERQDSYVATDMSRSILYKKRTEGKHPRDVVINFNWEKLEATRSDFGKKNKPLGILPGSFDPLALFFILRLQDLKENSVLEMPVTDGKKNIAMKAVVAKRATIRVDEKKYDTFEATPDMESLEGIVKKSDNPRLKIWFTADDKKIPVKIQMGVGPLSLLFELASIEP